MILMRIICTNRRVAVITGSGAKAFSAGMDLKGR